MFWLLALLAAGPDPLSRCDVLGPEAGADRTLSCPKGSALVTRDGPKIGEEPLIALMKQAMAGDDAKPRWSDGKLRVLGVERRALRYELPAKVSGVIVVVPVGDDRIRGYGCESTDGAWCAAVIDSLAAALPTPNKQNPETERARLLAGRAVAIPDGCAEKAPGLITCPKHSFSFANIPRDDPSTVDLMATSLLGGLSELGTVGSENVACAVEGVATTCRRLVIQRSDSRKMYVVLAFAEVRKQRVYVQCNSSEGIEPVPPACRSAISW